jgi:hypothetical protein
MFCASVDVARTPQEPFCAERSEAQYVQGTFVFEHADAGMTYWNSDSRDRQL